MAKKQIDMTIGKPLSVILAFTIPAILSNLLNQVYSITDSIIVGRIIGETALASIGVCMPVILLIASFTIGINIGCGVLLSQDYGRKNYESMRKTFINGIYFIIAFSVFVAIAGFFLARPILLLIKTPEGPLSDAVIYMKINFCTTIFPLFYYLLYNVFRSLGDSYSALYCLIVSVIFNIVLDLVFVLAFHLGVAGTAWATSLAQLCSVIFAFVLLFHKYPEMKFKKENMDVDFKRIGSITKLALPFALQNSINNIGSIAVQSCVNDFGETAMASYTIANRIGTFSLLPVENIGATMSVYTGQNYGARKEERIDKGLKASMLLNVIFSSVVGILLVFLGKWITSLFLENPGEELLTISYQYLLIAAVPGIFCGIMNIYQFTLKGMGKAKETLIAGIIQLTVKVGVSLLGTYVFDNIMIVWLSWPLSFIAGTVYPFIIYEIYKKELKSRKVNG